MRSSQTAKIRQKIMTLSAGELLTPNNFSTIPRNTAIKILNRIADEGILARLKRGVYSRCKNTRFGQAKATPLQVLSQEVANDNNKCFGGLFLFNQLGLTTQIPATIEILNNRSSYVSKVGNTHIRYVRIRPKISKSRKEHIQLLEVIKKIAQIPDGDITKTLHWLNKKLRNTKPHKLKLLTFTASEYPPRARALLGNLLEKIDIELSKKIKKSLNENSFYKIGTIVKHLKSPQSWNLKQ